MEFYPPRTRIAGRYEIAGRPLMGGMGIVYLCFDHDENRPVALKTFKPEYLPDRATRDRFLREGTAWVNLGRHPHIVHAYGVERIGDGREVYLVLELVAKEQGRENASLRSWLTPGVPLPVEQALLFALQIARGMAHATAKIEGFVHRDLKPENVLVGADRLSNISTNRLRVTDFGLVRALASSETLLSVDEGKPLSERPGLTRAGAVLGTPNYMAPEQWERTDVGLQADIYALGCILGEMLTGRMLIRERTLRSFRQAHQEGRAEEAAGNLPAPVGEVVSRCLALEPGERYTSWEELEQTLAGAYQAVTAHPAPGPEAVAALSRAERVAAGWSYSEMGASYLDIGKAEVALGYFERARAAGSAEGEPRLEAAGLGNLGLAYARLGETRRAIGYHEQALVIAREIGDRRGEGNALGNLGVAYAALGETRRAIGYYEQQLVITREIGDRRGEGNGLGNLGSAYADLGETRRAIGYYEQRLEIASEIGDRQGERNGLGNLGLAYARLGETRRAIGYFEQALVIDREIGDRRGEGAALGNLGNAYARLGDARRAIEYHEQALRINREIGDVLAAAMISANLAMSLAQVGRMSEALPLIEQAVHDFRQAGYPQQAQQAERMLDQIRGGGVSTGGPPPAEVLQQFAPLIAAAVAAARGDRAARAQVEPLFDTLTRNNWQIVEPIQRLWAGERDETTLTADVDPNSALIIREILKQLKG